MHLACPGCGFRTIEGEAYGSYDICPVCGWEDDNVQLHNPCSAGGANRISLHQCQQASASWSAEEMSRFERDPDWRPLSEAEVAHFRRVAERQHWTFMGETAPEEAYWRRPISLENTTKT
jgi:Cysteine-rich CPCC